MTIFRSAFFAGVRVFIDKEGRKWLDAAGTVPVSRCSRCEGMHEVGKCPIPEGYDPADYRKDSKGSSGCSCKD